MIKDYSEFDRVVAPVMIVSSDLIVSYTNPYAIRLFPFLSTPFGIVSRFEKAEVKSAVAMLKKGEVVHLPFDEALQLSFLFVPERMNDETLCVCVYVVSDSADPNAVFPYLADSELLRFLQKEVAEPTSFVLNHLKLVKEIIEKGDVSRALMAVRMIRTRILQMSLFYARMEDCSSKHFNNCEVADAVDVLLSCKRAIPFLKYEPTATCYIPLERSSQALLYADVFSSLIFRQDKPSISVSTSCDEKGVTVTIVSGPLDKPLNVPCNDEFDGIDLGMFSVRRRAALAGGTLNVSEDSRGAVTVTLKFSPVNLLMCNAILKDPSDSLPSPLEVRVLEYLELIGEDFS